jgi:hypothetical protein
MCIWSDPSTGATESCPPLLYTNIRTYVCMHACIQICEYVSVCIHVHTAESGLSDLRLCDIPFYPMCRVRTLHFINQQSTQHVGGWIALRHHAFASCAFYVLSCLTVQALAWSCCRKGRFRSKYPPLISSRNKLPSKNLYDVKCHFCDIFSFNIVFYLL